MEDELEFSPRRSIHLVDKTGKTGRSFPTKDRSGVVGRGIFTIDAQK